MLKQVLEHRCGVQPVLLYLKLHPVETDLQSRHNREHLSSVLLLDFGQPPLLLGLTLLLSLHPLWDGKEHVVSVVLSLRS